MPEIKSARRTALSPYLTAGIAIVGAAAVAVAPIRPADVQVPAPAAHAEHSVRLTAAGDELNQLLFDAAKAGVDTTALAAPLLALITGDSDAQARAALAMATLGLAGPLITVLAASQEVLQNLSTAYEFGLLDPRDPFLALNIIIGNAFGLVGYAADGNIFLGPDLSPLVPGATEPVYAGGLVTPPDRWWAFAQIPGAIPAMQILIDDIFGEADPPPDTGRPVEAAINSALLPIAAVALEFGKLAVPLLVENGVNPELAPGYANLIALGFVGPLITTPGAGGTAVQNVLDAVSTGHPGSILSSVVGAPGTVVDGLVNGGYGPNLYPLVTPNEVLEFPPPGTTDIQIHAGGLLDSTESSSIPGAVDIDIAGFAGSVNDVTYQLSQAWNRNLADSADADQAAERRTTADADNTTVAAEEAPAEPVKNGATPRFNVLKINPLDRTSTRTASAEVGTDGRKTLSQHINDAGASVRKLVTRVTGLGATKDNDTKTEGSQTKPSAAE